LSVIIHTRDSIFNKCKRRKEIWQNIAIFLLENNINFDFFWSFRCFSNKCLLLWELARWNKKQNAMTHLPEFPHCVTIQSHSCVYSVCACVCVGVHAGTLMCVHMCVCRESVSSWAVSWAQSQTNAPWVQGKAIFFHSNTIISSNCVNLAGITFL
jgi:hypothetical protein